MVLILTQVFGRFEYTQEYMIVHVEIQTIFLKIPNSFTSSDLVPRSVYMPGMQ